MSRPRYRPRFERLEARALLAVFEVTNSADGGDGSLRQAILDANAQPNVAEIDRIEFAIGSGPQTIALSSGLPAITEPVVIDGWSQPGFSGEVDDDLYRQVIGSYVKKMEKTRQEYLELGERGAAMAEKLAFEVEYLSRFLPKKLDEDATRTLVRSAIEALGVAGDEKAAGRVTGHVMKQHGKDLDGALVNRIVREELSAG